MNKAPLVTYAMCVVKGQHVEDPVLWAPTPGREEAASLGLQVLVAQHHPLHTRVIYT